MFGGKPGMEGEEMVNMDGCCGGSCSAGPNRSFLTKEEKIGMLEDYKKALESEAKGVAERIKELKKET